jgi:hypothetical protein
MSLISTFFCAMSLTLVYLGHKFWLQKHDADLLLSFFGISGGLMVVYAGVSGIYAKSVKEFDGGLLSARLTMCFIALITTCSFLYCGVELQSPIIDGRVAISDGQKFLAMISGPLMILVFAVTFAIYVHLVERDSKWRPGVDPDSLSGGPATLTIRLLNVATWGALLYCAFQSGWNHNAYAVLHYVVEEMLALFLCVSIDRFFAATVPPLLDRGLKPDSD